MAEEREYVGCFWSKPTDPKDWEFYLPSRDATVSLPAAEAVGVGIGGGRQPLFGVANGKIVEFTGHRLRPPIQNIDALLVEVDEPIVVEKVGGN